MHLVRTATLHWLNVCVAASTRALHRTSLPAAPLVQAILGCHLAQIDMPELTSTVGESLTDATIELYQSLQDALPPTPSRFHYLFNLRDLGRVYEGLLLASATTVPEPTAFLRLWRHEALRVFHDRLICPEDKQLMHAKLAEVVRRRCVHAMTTLVESSLVTDGQLVLQQCCTALQQK